MVVLACIATRHYYVTILNTILNFALAKFVVNKERKSDIQQTLFSFLPTADTGGHVKTRYLITVCAVLITVDEGTTYFYILRLNVILKLLQTNCSIGFGNI